MSNNCIIMPSNVVDANTDPLFSSVILLLNMDGVANSNVFADLSSKRKPVTLVGAPKVDGANSLILNGSSALTMPQHADNVFPGDYCWEYWLTSALDAVQDQLGCGPMSFNGGNPQSWAMLNLNNQLQTYPKDYLWNGHTNVAPNVRHHIAAYRIGSQVYVALDGVVATSTSNVYSGTIGNATSILAVGGRGGGNPFTVGKMGPVRITKGNARYPTTNFTPPAFGPFPTK